MIGILGGMGTQAGLDFCNKLAKLNRGKMDQKYPMFILYNKSNTPKRPENLKKYTNVLKELVAGCKMLQKNKARRSTRDRLNQRNEHTSSRRPSVDRRPAGDRRPTEDR